MAAKAFGLIYHYFYLKLSIDLFIIGNQEECLATEKFLSESLKDASLKAKQSKELAPKQANNNTNNLIKDCNKEFYESTIKELESKLIDKEQIISKHLESIDKLQREIQSIQDENTKKQNGIESINSVKLIDIATCIYDDIATYDIATCLSRLIENAFSISRLKMFETN